MTASDDAFTSIGKGELPPKRHEVETQGSRAPDHEERLVDQLLEPRTRRRGEGPWVRNRTAVRSPERRLRSSRS